VLDSVASQPWTRQLLTNKRISRDNVKQEALLMQRNRASTLSVEIVLNAAQMFGGLHLKKPATDK